MSSIYKIDAWDGTLSYRKNDIVSYNSVYYYALQSISPSATAPSLDPSNWGGTRLLNGQSRAFFIWTPSYDSPVNSEPKVKVTQFGDGYEQSSQDGINNLLLNFDVTFNERTTVETRAILHFLYARKGVERFIYLPPEPYAEYKLFVCRKWSDSKHFYNNHSIHAVFEERVA